MNYCPGLTPCWHHRYHVVHVVIDSKSSLYGEVLDHSQGTWDYDLKNVPRKYIKSFPSEIYQHGMTASDLMRAVEKKEVAK